MFAVALNEFKMHWRRRVILIITISLLVFIFLSIFIVKTDNNIEWARFGNRSELGWLTVVVIFLTWAPIGATMIFIAPVLFADTIPLDQQLGTRELLDSLPLPRSTYLAGKVLGVWMSLLASMLFVMITGGVAWWIAAGSFDLIPYLGMWVVGVGSAIILNVGLGVLVAAGQPSRNRAVVIVIVILMLPFFLGANLIFSFDNVATWISPHRGALINYYLLNDQVTVQQLALTIGIGLVELAILWFAMWGWLRWRDQHV